MLKPILKTMQATNLFWVLLVLLIMVLLMLILLTYTILVKTD